MLWYQLMLLLILFEFGFRDGWSLADLGVATDVSPATSFAVGVVCYAAFILAFHRILVILGVEDRFSDASFEPFRIWWPRDRKQKVLLGLSACLLNPITEEVAFRGVLIHALGEQIGSVTIAIVIGLSLSMLAHVYQGVWAMPGQFLFHGVAVLMLISPFGLIACIGFHVAGDLYPTLMIRRMMNEWVVRRRCQGRLPATASLPPVSPVGTGGSQV